MLSQIAQFLVDTVVAFLVFVLLARFHFQWLRVPFRNPLGEFVVACSNWLVMPARRVIPSLGGLDLATALAAWALQVLALYLMFALRGGTLEAQMGAVLAAFAMLGAVDLLRYSLYLLVFAIIVQAVLSWVNPYHPFAGLFGAVTRPFLGPLRRMIPPIANVDLTPLVLLVIVQIALILVANLRVFAGGGV